MSFCAFATLSVFLPPFINLKYFQKLPCTLLLLKFLIEFVSAFALEQNGAVSEHEWRGHCASPWGKNN